MGRRTEKDSLGKLVLDSSVPWGIYTQRVLDTYPQDSSNRLPEDFLRTYIEAKMIYATVNARFRKISQEKKRAIHTAGKKILWLWSEELMKFFPIGQVQSWWGTSTNMMINEVLANEATVVLWWKYWKYIVNPHDDLNASQSSNDTFPGVTKLILLKRIPELLTSLHGLEKTCKRLSQRWKNIKKVGRTHLQDAVVILLWDEFWAFARTLEKNRKYLNEAQKVLLELNFWWTATWSLQNISSAIRKELNREFSKGYKKKFIQPKSYFEQNSSSGDIAWVVQAMNHCANNLLKIGNDLRLLSSWPLAWLHEIDLPAVQAGSSIMPWKVNPSVVEAVTMLLSKIHGADHTVHFLTRQSQLQLQQFMPQIAWSSLDAMNALTQAVTLLDQKCMKWIIFNKKHIKYVLEHSLAEATNYSEQYWYEVVAKAVVEALKTQKTLDSILSNKKKIRKV